MKKIFYLALSLLAFAMTSCFEEEEFGLTGATYEDFTGEISEVDTRTSMGSDGSVLWSENDAISLFKKTGYHQKYKVKTYGSSSTDFQYDDYSTEVTLSSDSHYAVYPFAEGNSISGTELTINLSSLAEQSYTANTFENGKAVMVAKSATTQLAFTNAFSLANIQLKAEAGEAPDEKISVKKIKVESATIPLYGTATIDMSENTPAAKFAPDGGKSIVLDCNADIELSTTPTDFYILMPVATFPEYDLTITIYATIAGEQKELAIPMSIEVPFLRSKMTTLTKEIGFDDWTGSTEITVVNVSDVDAANDALVENAGVKLEDATDAVTNAITIPAKEEASEAAVEHMIDLSEAEMPTSGAVKITVEEAANSSENTVTEVTVVVPNGTSADGLEINAPGTTVTITAADGTVIKKIVGASAENTLIISKGITVEELIVKKGNVRIEEGATVTTITRDGVNEDPVTYVIYDGSVPTNAVSGNKIIHMSSAAYELKKAVEDAEVKYYQLQTDVVLAETLIIPENKTFTLNLNGKTISQTQAQAGAYSMIDNRGTLIIKDTQNGGKIAYADIAELADDVNYVSNTISNSGTLTIESGIIENNSTENVADKGYPHPIDNSGILTINGGTITNNANYSSMRIWCTTDDNTKVTINGGTLNGSIDFHNVNTKANKGTLTITGGTFNADEHCGCAIRLLGFGTDVDEMNGYINGGTFNGKILLKNYIGSGEFNSQVFFITGGTFSEDPTEFLADGYVVEGGNGSYKIAADAVAKIGSSTYPTLMKAIEAVNDGGTITLLKDVTFTEKNRINNGGNWYEGVLYDGDKSFTIDLNGKTINQNGAVNDYLMLFKNNGAKANTITLKNGTIDAGKTAYCAIATASSNAQKMTMNLEDIELNGNNSGGAVVKFRGGGELNVKAGTIITGNDSYAGVEVYGTETVGNIFEGVEIYQNGTSSYVGAIIGASGGATVNIKGGKGMSAKCGLIVMTSGGTINVEGGEWIANNDGTPATDNYAVLASQFDNASYPTAISSVINVTGGTFKGGYNCYGNVADKAFIRISGGNFNADPKDYVVAGYEVSGSYTVGKPQAQIELEKAIAKGGLIILYNDVNLAEPLSIESGEVKIDMNGMTITAASTSAFEVKKGAKLTLLNGNVTAHEAVVRALGGEVVIEYGNFKQTGTAVGSTPATYRYCIDVRNGGKVTIDHGTFESGNGMFNVNEGCELVVNDGNFTNIIEKLMTRHFAYVSGKLTINGGDHQGFANKAAGGCFFCGAASTCEITVNGGKFRSEWNGKNAGVNNIFEVYSSGATINVTGGIFNTNGGISSFVEENTDESTKDFYPYVATGNNN